MHTPGSDVFVRLQNINLSFKMNVQRDGSLRQHFVDFLKNPAAAVMAEADLLHVLKDINFEAHRGDRIAIMGRNGAGKSTLCRLISGVYKPQTGTCTVQGKLKSILDPSATIYPDLTGRENARIILQLMHPEIGSELKSVLSEALAFSGLGSFLDIPVRNYSTGMHTRLCLSLATALPADIFILDEVFEGADADFGNRVAQRMIQLIEKAGIVFFVSHSIDQVQTICNKGILIHDGEIKITGDINKVVEAYNRIPAGLLGHS